MVYVMFGWDSNGFNKFKTDFIKGLRPTKVVIMNAMEHDHLGYIGGEWGGVNKILSLVGRLNIPVILVLGSSDATPETFDFSNPFYKNLKVVHWWNYWLTATFFRQKINIVHNINKSGLNIDDVNSLKKDSYKYRYIYLNNQPHLHRCYLIDQMAKYNLIDKGAVSWIEPKSNYSEITRSLRNEIFKHWSPRILTLDVENIDGVDLNILPKEYATSWVHLISESTVDRIFITEKTANSLFFMKPFIVGSCKGFHAELKNKGFYLYDEIFDYDFDLVEDMETRFDLVAQNIKRVTEMSDADVSELNRKVLPKLEANRELAIDLATNLSNQPKVMKVIYKSFSNSGFNVMFKFMFDSLKKE